MFDKPLAGRTVLLVENEYFLATELSRSLESQGATVIGPISNLQQGIDALARSRPDAAVLDINLDGDLVYPLADTLAAAKVPFLFASGYDRDSLPGRFADVTLIQKPIEPDKFGDLFT